MIELQWLTDGETPECRHAIERAMQTALAGEHKCGDVCVRVTDEPGIQALNRDFRGIDAVTDVLTFPAEEGDDVCAPPDRYIGDVAICFPRAKEQAERFGHSLLRELSFLSVHGALHLCGYDHLCPDDEARMFSRQDEILEGLGITR